jgi:hypothetical protein
VKAALTDQILILNDKIWTARPRIVHVVIFQASAPRIFNAAGLIGPAAAAGSAAIALVAEDLAAVIASAAEDLAAVIALAVEDSVAAALAGSVAAVLGADDEN